MKWRERKPKHDDAHRPIKVRSRPRYNPSGAVLVNPHLEPEDPGMMECPKREVFNLGRHRRFASS